jgi:hypothetical protein
MIPLRMWYIAPSGGGKTTIIKLVREVHSTMKDRRASRLSSDPHDREKVPDWIRVLDTDVIGYRTEANWHNWIIPLSTIDLAGEYECNVLFAGNGSNVMKVLARWQSREFGFFCPGPLAFEQLKSRVWKRHLEEGRRMQNDAEIQRSLDHYRDMCDTFSPIEVTGDPITQTGVIIAYFSMYGRKTWVA